MTAAGAPGPRPALDMGRVIGRTWAALGAHGLILLPTGLLVVAAPEFVLDFLRGRFLSGGTAAQVGYYLVSILVGTAGAALLQGATAHAVVNGFEDRRAGPGEVVRTALARFPVLMLIGVAVTIGISLGAVLLIVPGVLLALMCTVAEPVAVIERVGFAKALSRSGDLTRNHRWSILGLSVIYLVLVIALTGGMTLLTNAIVAANWVLDGWLIAIGILDAALQGMFSVVAAVGVSTLYFELRAIKEGGGRESVAAIFG